MGQWQAAAIGAAGAGLGAGALVLVLCRANRWRWRAWCTAVVVVAAGLGTVTSVALVPPQVVGLPAGDRYGMGTVRLGSADLDERLRGIQELELAMWQYGSRHQPDVMRRLAAFVRERAPAAGAPGCAKPARDVDLAMTVLGRRDVAKDENTVMDLRRVCLAHLQQANADFQLADLTGADLTRASLVNDRLDDARLGGAVLAGADLRQTSLVGADLTGADLTGADLSGVRWSDDTRWPERYAPRVSAASSGTTSEHVIGELRLP